MGLISTLKQLRKNINNVEKYLAIGTDEEKMETYNLIKRGTCFVAYTIDEEVRFAPSRFVGYVYNELYKHALSEKDGRETNKAISKVLGAQPLPNIMLEGKYLDYCRRLGILPNDNGAFGAPRKYWTLEPKEDIPDKEELSGEFSEGNVIERTHKVRERDNRVNQKAKGNYKEKHGGLFCQACGFDFEKKYGILGRNVIECHHIIPVSEMLPGDKTKPKDIAMLCANCHLIVHKRNPCLTMEELKKLLKNDDDN